jgi:hypothetical protein
MTLGVIFREPVLVLLGIIVALGVDIGRRIAASRPKKDPGGRFENGRWIDMAEPRQSYVGGDISVALVGAALEAAEEVAPKVKAALEERAREGKT